MNSPLPEITVIIPTLALAERRERLQCALASVRGQSGVAARVVIVVNGSRFDPELVRTLQSAPETSVITREEASLPAAIVAGRRLVETPWFTVLDDDDILLPGALALRMETLAGQPDLDAVVTNGYRRSVAGERLHVTDAEAVQRDPLRALLDINWLLQGSWLCRTEALGPALLKDMPKHLECTYLAACFASAGRMRFLETPTVAWSQDTPDSLSKSQAYRLGEVDALKAIRRLPGPGWFRRGIDRKTGDACHSLAEEFRESGQRAAAWRWHLRSLGHRGGLRYLIPTRHFITMMFRA